MTIEFNAPTATLRLTAPNGRSTDTPVEYHWEDNFGQGGFWRPWLKKPAHKVWAELEMGGADDVELTLDFVDFTEGFAVSLMKVTHQPDRAINMRRNGSAKYYDSWPTAGALVEGWERIIHPEPAFLVWPGEGIVDEPFEEETAAE